MRHDDRHIGILFVLTICFQSCLRGVQHVGVLHAAMWLGLSHSIGKDLTSRVAVSDSMCLGSNAR